MSQSIVTRQFRTSDATTSTTITTGALQSAGGLGVALAGTFGGILKTTAATASSSTTTGSLQAGGGLGVAGAAFIGGAIKTTDTTASTTTTDGSLIAGGGLGVAGAANIGGILKTTSTTAATNATSGALQSGGGLGVAGAIYGGSTLTINNGVVNTIITSASNVTIQAPQTSGTLNIKSISAKNIVSSAANDNNSFGNNTTVSELSGSPVYISCPTVTGTLTTSGSFTISGATINNFTTDSTRCIINLQITCDTASNNVIMKNSGNFNEFQSSVTQGGNIVTTDFTNVFAYKLRVGASLPQFYKITIYKTSITTFPFLQWTGGGFFQPASGNIIMETSGFAYGNSVNLGSTGLVFTNSDTASTTSFAYNVRFE